MPNIKIDPQFRDLIEPLSADEQTDLEENILANGCLDPIVKWRGEDILLDGHNRFSICTKHSLTYAVIELEFGNREDAMNWMILNQVGRRNLSPEQLSYLRGKLYLNHKKSHGGNRNPSGRKGKESSGKNDPSSQSYPRKLKTSENFAKELKVSEKTVRNNANFAEAVDSIEQQIGTAAKQKILQRGTNIPKKDITKLAAIAERRPDVAAQIIESGSSAQIQKTYAEIKREDATIAAENKVAVPLVLTAPPTKGAEIIVAPVADWMEKIETPKGTLNIWHKTPKSKPGFTKTTDSVDWALWTWNPVTGCWHSCDYCYAREIANNARMAAVYPNQFEPTYHPYRLTAPSNSKPLNEAQLQTEIDERMKGRNFGLNQSRADVEAQVRSNNRNVFVCSMADLFGKWVPDEWILSVFKTVLENPQWNFLFLTKFPQRLQEINDILGGFPDNAWVGTTVDTQARVALAEKSFANIQAKVKWLSCEPLLEKLTFNSLGMFDLVAIGGQSASYFNGTPDLQPEWEWVESLLWQARASGTSVYWKQNLTIRPQEIGKFKN